jgi:hypothetical protein
VYKLTDSDFPYNLFLRIKARQINTRLTFFGYQVTIPQYSCIPLPPAQAASIISCSAANRFTHRWRLSARDTAGVIRCRGRNQ